MKISSIASLGSIVAVLVFGSAYLAFGVVRVDTFREFDSMSMVLTNSGSVGPRSPVLLTGVEVGEVTSVANVEDGVQVDFRVERKFSIPTASVVRIENISALGEPYIEFTPRTADGPYLTDGAQVDTSTIRMPISIPEVSRLVTEVLNQLDPTAISSLINTFDEALEGTESIVPQLSRSTDLLAATLLSRTPKFAGLLIDLQAIAPDMDWVGPAFETGSPLWRQFAERVDSITQSVERFSNTGDTPAMYVEGNGLVPFLNRLAEYFDTTGPDFRALAPAVQPLAELATDNFPQVDLSALIAQALESTSPDGAVRLQINVK
ncbi:MCE family protein [Antrihabitans sp. YC3-6]|uniref:MCE family protein n=1 Tax=Antrihabitans stalagmiti TaxID=2799499 RepID=A0A934NPR4_9NOCA|nr:MlaD family protein [Antrihabitans stalagmiti]MBJ8339072.1 MCE family protein [Antrihabitans stalagmiti]